MNILGRYKQAQDTVEYGLLIATVAIVVLLGVGTFGGVIREWFIRLVGVVTSR